MGSSYFVEDGSEVCCECGRKATRIVNNIACVCDYHGEQAKFEGFIVENINKYQHIETKEDDFNECKLNYESF